MKKLIAVSLIFVFLTLFVNAQELARYDFDEIEVTFAAEFTAKPVNVYPDNWLVNIAGGAEQPINVLYGIVELKKDGKTEIVEEFIRVDGKEGFERFLHNSRTAYIEGQLNFPIPDEVLYEADMDSHKQVGSDESITKAKREISMQNDQKDEISPQTESPNHYFIVDDYGPASDVRLVANLTKRLENDVITNYQTKLTSEVTKADFNNRVSIFIYKSKVLIIAGEKYLENKLLAEKISSILKNEYGIEAVVKTDSEVKIEDLIDELELPKKETEGRFSGDIETFFWSAKKIVDFDLVKDFTPPIKSVSLYFRYKDGYLYEILLSAPEVGEKESQTTSSPPLPSKGEEVIIQEGDKCAAESNDENLCYNHCTLKEKKHYSCRDGTCKCFETKEEIPVKQVFDTRDAEEPNLTVILTHPNMSTCPAGTFIEGKKYEDGSVYYFCNTIRCVDVDEKDYYNINRVIWPCEGGTCQKWDFCDGGVLQERICRNDLEPDTEYYNCPNGCLSGACIWSEAQSNTSAILVSPSRKAMKEGDACDPQSSNDIVACVDYCDSIGKNVVSCENNSCSCQ